MKKLTNYAIAGLAAITMLAGCSDKTPKSEQGAMKDDQKIVEVVAKGFQHDYWKAVRLGAEKAAKEENVTMNFVGPKDESAVAEQLEMLNNAINKKPTAIALAALDTNSELDAINSAIKNNIPIIGFDSGVPGAPEGAIKATASTDNMAAGANASQHMFDFIKDKIGKEVVRIGVVSQEANSLSITQRTQGFIDDMVSQLEKQVGKGQVAIIGHDKFKNDVKEDAAKVIIEVRIPAQVDDASGKTEASTLLDKKDLIAIYGSNEFAAKAIINANSALNPGRLGQDKIIAVGFDSGALQQDAIRQGVFVGSITQDPVQIGYQTIKLAVKAANNEAVKDIDTGSQWYDASNIDNEEIKPLLYK